MVAEVLHLLNRPLMEDLRVAMSFDEFLTIPDSKQAEWVNGEAIIFAATTEDHARAMILLARLIADYAEAVEAGAVYLARYGMRLHPEGPFREPDVMFVAADHRHRIETIALTGPADLV